jgi:Ca2+/H+ antiporter
VLFCFVLPIFFCGIFVRFSAKKHHNYFLEKIHVKNFLQKSEEKDPPSLSRPWPFLRFFIAFLAVSLHADFKNTTKYF